MSAAMVNWRATVNWRALFVAIMAIWFSGESGSGMGQGYQPATLDDIRKHRKTSISLLLLAAPVLPACKHTLLAG